MPLYEYRCGSCSRVFEAYKRLSDETSAERCPACGEKAVRTGLSVVSDRTGRPGSPRGGTSCGGSRRSPFS